MGTVVSSQGGIGRLPGGSWQLRAMQDGKGAGSRSPRRLPCPLGWLRVTLSHGHPWVRAASGQWGMQPGQVGEGAGCPGRRGTAGPSQGPASQTVLCPAEVALPCPPFPWGLRGGALGSRLPPASESSLFPAQMRGPVLSRTVSVSSPSSTVETHSVRAAGTTPVLLARECNLKVSGRWGWPVQARGIDRAQPELIAAGVEECLQAGVRTPGQMGASVGSYGTLAGRRFSCSGI